MRHGFLRVLSGAVMLFTTTGCGGDDDKPEGGNSGTPDVAVGDTVAGSHP